MMKRLAASAGLLVLLAVAVVGTDRIERFVSDRLFDIRISAMSRTYGDSAAVEALKNLPVVDVDKPQGRYNREDFARQWGYIDGCKVRDAVLRRDLDDVVMSVDNCKVVSGRLTDTYFDGGTVEFRRGGDDRCVIDTNGRKSLCSQAVQIDHVVPVHVAWEKGAWAWDKELKNQYYNDPSNLIAMSGYANNEKTDKRADEWMPSTVEGRCEYAKKYVHTLEKYGLPVTSGEREALLNGLMRCELEGDKL